MQKIDRSTGNPVLVTYLGGTESEVITDMKVTKSGHVWILGLTDSETFVSSSTGYTFFQDLGLEFQSPVSNCVPNLDITGKIVSHSFLTTILVFEMKCPKVEMNEIFI